MRLQIKKWIVVVLVVPALLVLITYFIDRAIHCKEGGLTRDDALTVANSKLEMQFKSNSLLPQFKLMADRFESDKSWVFTYRASDCITDVIIDKCGTADIGGLSGGCISR